ncbi:hypothetical protein GL263_07260, partial [Streptomyces durbertensis]|nr:hypothetical protein [Streptomyces durbertensis]
MPGGRAAMAVMPSALLLGIGLSPNVAGAQPGGRDNPFQDGPCVSAPDRVDTDPEAAGKPGAGPTPGPERSAAPPSSAPPSSAPPSSAAPERRPGGTSGGAEPSAAPTSSPT